MGHLKLLYCDSAGVRRCRVLVCETDAPAAAALAGNGNTASQAAANGPTGLDATPSIMLATSAGCIPAPQGSRAPLSSHPSLQNLSMRRVSEDRVLSPEASELEQQLEQQQQQQQQDAQQQGSEQVSGATTPTLPKLGSFTTPPGMRPSPSMILAAATGAIAPFPGTMLPRFHSNSSLDELAGMTAVPDYNQPLPPGWGNSSSGANLSPTPSMSLAAAAGAITLNPAGGSNSSSRHASPSRFGSSSNAAGVAAMQLGGSQQQQQQQQQQQHSPLTKLSAAKPRGALVSAFVRSPLNFASSSLNMADSAAALAAAANFSVGLTKACMGQPAYADLVVEASGLAPVGEVLLVPDLSAAVAVPGSSLGDVMAPVDMMEKDLSQPWSCCPRSALKRTLAALELRFGLTLMVGFELEFVLLKPAPLELFRTFPAAAAGSNVIVSNGQAWVPVDASIYCQASALCPGTHAVLSDIVSSLQSIGIGVTQYHPEAAPGQFEVVLSAFPALQAADKLLLAKEVVCNAASSHGLAVTWLPKPMAGEAGSGVHMHFSLWQGGDSIMADAAAAVAGAAASLPPGSYPLSTTANSFLAGVLEHVPALLPFTAPSVNSFERFKPSCWSGAFVCWGYDNREAPLRVCCPRGGPQAVNAECKAFDGTANPYIGLAAVVAAGMLGLEGGRLLPAELQCDPGTSGNAAMAEQLQRLPDSLTAALECWGSDTQLQAALQAVLGADLIRAYVAVRQCEAEANPKLETLLLRY